MAREVEITSEHQYKYKQAPDTCPFCDSEEITGGNFDASGTMVWREVRCNTCKRFWTENFDLTSISEAYQ